MNVQETTKVVPLRSKQKQPHMTQNCLVYVIFKWSWPISAFGAYDYGPETLLNRHINI